MAAKRFVLLGHQKQPRTASLIQTMQHTKYKNFDTFTPNQWTFELTFILFSSSAFSFLFWLQLLKEFSRSSGFHSLLCVQEGATATFPSQFVQQILFFRRINACLVLNYPGPFFFFSFCMLSWGYHAWQTSFYTTILSHFIIISYQLFHHCLYI